MALSGLIDYVFPAAGPWAVAGKALSYLLKLEPIIWWAMPVPASAPPSPEGAGKIEVNLEVETSSFDQPSLSPPDCSSDKELPPLYGLTITHLFHDLLSDYEPKDSEYNDSDSYGYSVLAVPETVSVLYKLCSGKTSTTTCIPLAKAKAMVALPYPAQAHYPPVIVNLS
ncbi:hypothetical protein DSO57_1013173 [Entomophthora muscae]|uniref:Uncharacterized protein n=1 Tax=Entomophthora muscae TaxID=34485 RepID=A0ACC2UR73_9FUNG|nr:hypothetical protein DSO57_1013173 [Entomophthora muscae]